MSHRQMCDNKGRSPLIWTLETFCYAASGKLRLILVRADFFSQGTLSATCNALHLSHIFSNITLKLKPTSLRSTKMNLNLGGMDATQIKLMEEECILVDDHDRKIGSSSKKICHMLENINKGWFYSPISIDGKLTIFICQACYIGHSVFSCLIQRMNCFFNRDL